MHLGDSGAALVISPSSTLDAVSAVSNPELRSIFSISFALFPVESNRQVISCHVASWSVLLLGLSFRRGRFGPLQIVASIVLVYLL